MSDELQERFRAILAEELQRRDLAAWMRTHRAEMAAMLKGGKMDWEAAAEHFRRHGLYADGQAPEAANVEAIWQRVSRQRRR